MQRRTFFKTAALAGFASPGLRQASAYVPTHNWDKYDFGSGPSVKNRLNQGPFPHQPPERVYPTCTVMMATTPSEDVVPNFGKGPVTYITGNMGLAEILGDDKLRAIEDLVRMPLGQKLYLRPTWREVQPRRGRLDLPEYFKVTLDLAKKYNKRLAFRVQLRAPDYRDEALPQYILDNVPMVRLQGVWKPVRKAAVPEPRYDHEYYEEPRYDHPYFQEAFAELNALLAAEFNGNPLIEFFDTFMYGFWGEAHTAPFHNNPFPDYRTAERTWVRMMEVQLENWTKTPLLTNVQPDFSQVGNSEMVDMTVRSHNWLRVDTIYVSNEQIEMISNRPPWIGAAVETGGAQGIIEEPAESILHNEGVTSTDNGVQHVMDIGTNYWSLWHRHSISVAGIMNYYQQYPKMIDQMCRKIGYNVRPSFVWVSGPQDPRLFIGFANDGIAGVPGVLYVSVVSDDGKVNVGGGLDPGYPLPGKIRQAEFILPPGTNWEGLKLKAELEVKGVRYPVRWGTRQQTNPDGSLTLRINRPVGPNGY